MKAVFVVLFVVQLGLGLGFCLDADLGLIVSDQVRVRASASTDAKIITTLNTGTVLHILSRGQSGERLIVDLPRSYWYEVDTPKGIGYVWGGFFWPMETQPPVSKDLTPVYIHDGKSDFLLNLVFWSDSPDQGNSVPEYDDHQLIGLSASNGEIYLIKLPSEFRTDQNRVGVNSDGYLVLSSGMGGYQTIGQMEIDKGILTILVDEETNGGEQYHTKITARLLGKKSSNLRTFEVISID